MPRKKKAGRAANGLGNIRENPITRNGKEYIYWQARYTAGYDSDGKQIQRTISGKTKKEVTEKYKKILCSLDKGTNLEPCNMTVEKWLEIWTRDYCGDVKESTAYLYKRTIKLYISPNLGAIKLTALTAPEIQRLYNSLSNPEETSTTTLSPKSIRNIHGVLHKTLQQAVLLGYIGFNPCDACKLPKRNETPVTALDEVQVSAFLSAIENHPHEYFYKIALFTGLREGELLGLTWDCVDFEKMILTVKQQLCHEQQKGGKVYFSTPKNGKSRTIALPSSVIELFKLQKAHQNEQRMKAREIWEEHNLVFTNANGRCLSYRTVYDCFKRIMAKIGSPKSKVHDLRHTYTTLSFGSGCDVKTVQNNLGHATPEFTLDVYAHTTTSMQRESAERLDATIREMTGK